MLIKPCSVVNLAMIKPTARRRSTKLALGCFSEYMLFLRTVCFLMDKQKSFCETLKNNCSSPQLDKWGLAYRKLRRGLVLISSSLVMSLSLCWCVYFIQKPLGDPLLKAPHCSRMKENCAPGPHSRCCDPCASCHCRFFNTICRCWRLGRPCQRNT